MNNDSSREISFRVQGLSCRLDTFSAEVNPKHNPSCSFTQSLSTAFFQTLTINKSSRPGVGITRKDSHRLPALIEEASAVTYSVLSYYDLRPRKATSQFQTAPARSFCFLHLICPLQKSHILVPECWEKKRIEFRKRVKNVESSGDLLFLFDLQCSRATCNCDHSFWEVQPLTKSRGRDQSIQLLFRVSGHYREFASADIASSCVNENKGSHVYEDPDGHSVQKTC